jgi:translation initiation factor IF-2
MPQTLESISHAKAAGVAIVVAMNKMDLPSANPDRLMAQLQEQGLAPEAWGGTTPVVPVSALKGMGIDTLLETALLEAEVLELKANPEAPCRAIIVESRVEPGKGPSATIIPRSGTLKVGSSFICGPFYGKVKSMLNDAGKAVQEAGPAIPVEVIGFSALPNVGDELVVMDDREAKKLSELRVSEQRLEKLGIPRRTSLETLFRQMEAGEKKNLRIILKSDVQGSLEAISGQLKDIKSDKITLEIIHQAVGPISENDVLLAGASDAIIIGFSTKVEGKAVKVAKSEGVQIKLFSIIYELFDQVKEAMLGMLDPISREKQLGTALVKQVFKINKGKIGGCVVTSGRIARSARARVVRGKEKVPVYDGGFHTLRRFTEDVTEVRNGLECGIRLGDFNDYLEGDVIECYELEKIAQGL